MNSYNLKPYRLPIGSLVLLAGLWGITCLLPAELSLQRKIAAYFAILAMISMALAFLLATRSYYLELIFGGLDKVYLIHRIAGMVAVAGILLHWLFVPQAPGGSRSDWNISEIGSDSGEWALWFLLTLVVISFSGFVPYRFWKWTHKLMGAVFLITVVHFLLAVKPFGLFSAPGIAMLITSVIGIWAWVYYAFGFDRSKKSMASVQNIHHWDNGVEFDARPVGKDVSWKAGQFAFISFIKNNRISSESHPFTISSASKANNIHDSNFPRFSIKSIGDYTRQLKKHIQEKDLIILDMPYGHFTLPKTDHRQVWIGVGIGITPFLAWLNNIQLDNKSKAIHLYYCAKNQQDAVYNDEIKSQLKKLEPITYSLICSSEQRLNAEKIYQDLGQQLKQTHVYFCGNATMRETLKSDLIDKGLTAKNFHYELFEFRSNLLQLASDRIK